MIDCLHKENEGWIGWMGFGGSIFQWHPEEKISFGYVPFDFVLLDMANKSGNSIKQTVQ